jgi:PAS domain S-box-containing protein
MADEITERTRAEERAWAGTPPIEDRARILERIAQGAPLHETLDSLLRVIEAHTPGMLCSILLLDSDGLRVRHGAAPSLPDSYNRAIDGEPIGPRAGSCGTAAYRKEPVIVDDIATDPLWADYRDVALAHDLRACWSTPIFDADRQVLGTFALYFRTPGRPRDEHRHLIDISTHIAAIAIVQAREREAIRRREAQLAEAQRIAHLGSYDWNVQADKVYRSEELCRIFGVTTDEFTPTFEGYLERVHPEDRAATRRRIEEALRDRVPFDFEERIVRPDGAIRQLRSRGSWSFDESGNLVTLVGTCQDITDQKLTEERLRRTEREASERQKVAELLAAKNEELKAFAYTVSHDLKAPLRAIAGYARELEQNQRAGLADRPLWCLRQIGRAAHNLERLIEELLEYSRLDMQAPIDGTVRLQDVVDAILRDRSTLIRSQGALVNVRLSTAPVRTWERGLSQVLTNLIDNALKYSREASPPRIQIESETRPGNVTITVADNGIGFDMKHHERIFGLFTRLVSPETFEGTGAGLAIAKKLVDKMGGRIWAESAPGRGATFFVDLPQAQNREQAA